MRTPPFKEPGQLDDDKRRTDERGRRDDKPRGRLERAVRHQLFEAARFRGFCSVETADRLRAARDFGRCSARSANASAATMTSAAGAERSEPAVVRRRGTHGSRAGRRAPTPGR